MGGQGRRMAGGDQERDLFGNYKNISMDDSSSVATDNLLQ